MSNTTRVNQLTDLGNITTGDKVVGERVDGTTVRLSYQVEVLEDTSPQLGGNLDVNDKHIVDANGNELLKLTKVASAVNEMTLTNAATTSYPVLSATGGDTNIDLGLSPKGTGSVHIAYEDARTNTTVYPLTIAGMTSGTATTDIGAGYRVQLENGAGTTYTAGAVSFASSDATAASEDTYGSMSLVVAGNTLAEKYRWASTSTTSKVTFTHANASDQVISYQDVTGTVYVSSGTDVTVADGGTGRSSASAYSVICAGTTSTGAFQDVSGVGTASQVLTSNGADLLPTWQDNPGSSPAALTRVDDTNVTITLGGSPSTALLAATSLTVGWTGQLPLTRGGSNASLTASNGGIIYSTATAMAVLSGTATANQILVSGSSAAPAWSTATFPVTAGSAGTIMRSNGTNWVNSTSTFADTYAASTLLYSNGANTVAGLATANSASLVTSSTGVPVWSSTMTNGQIIIGSTSATPTAATLTAGPGVSITNGAGSITISASGSGGSLASVQVFTSSGTWNRPAGISIIAVECLGAGGGGGGVDANTSQISAAGGGGSGGYGKILIDVTAISSETVTIGALGAGGAAGNNNGSTGGTSSFGAHISCTGGTGGSGSSASSGSSFRTAGGTGGTSSSGDVNGTGSTGFPGNAQSAACNGGNGAASQYGGGGDAVILNTSGSTAGTNATGYGAGGGGAVGLNSTTDRAGGNGTAGLIIVWEYT